MGVFLDEQIASRESGVETIFVDESKEAGGGLATSEYDGRIVALRAKGVDVVRGAIEFWDAVGRMEDILSREREAESSW